MNPDGSSDQTLQERIGTARVARFFLRLYALQLKAPVGAPVRYTLVDSEFSGIDNIYNLSVKTRGRFEHRRLTIGQLGAHSSSKSFCYKVVFDDPLVVKIPATPIETFQQYLKSLKRQRLIVDRFDADKRIIAPGVTAFFKCSQILDDFYGSSPRKLESRGVRWLESHPEYHQYLKIGDSFVFLMDLSAYTFLSDAIYRIHDATAEIPDEIVSHPNVLWDFHGFENRYGRERTRVHFLMNSVWAEYEKKARQLAREVGIRPRTIYEQRQWLLGQLAGLSPEYPGDASPEFVVALENLLVHVLDKNRKVVDAYRKTVTAYVKRVTFSKNTAKIRGLIISLLDLLVWLEQSGLAIRDLKPDNLFIAGDTDRYPNLTADTQKNYLGLIDIETAIGLGGKAESPAQPLLGGTPSYATLSQFFPNTILARVYPDIGLILHLQDWYAVAVMIFETVTGHQLFPKTRKLLFDIKALSRKRQSEAVSPVAAYCGSNYVFWHRSAEEFDRNIRVKKRRLEAIRIEPGEAARDMVLRHAKRQLSKNSEATDEIIRLHSEILDQPPNRHLATTGWEALNRLRQQMEMMTQISTHLSEQQEHLLGFVKSLERHRLTSESLNEGISALELPEGELSVFALLRLMFYTVACAMETPRPPWGRNPGAGALSSGENLRKRRQARSTTPPSAST